MSKNLNVGVNVSNNSALTAEEIRERELEALADQLLEGADNEPSDDDLESIEEEDNRFEETQPDDESEKEEEEMENTVNTGLGTRTPEEMADAEIRAAIEAVENQEAEAEKGFSWSTDPETGEAIRVKNVVPGQAITWKNKGHQRNVGFRVYALMDLGLTVKEIELAIKARIDSGEFKPSHKPDGYDALYKGLGTGTAGRKAGSKKGYITVVGHGEIKKEYIKGGMYKIPAAQIQSFVEMAKILGNGLSAPIGFQYDLGSEQSKANALKKAALLAAALR